MSGAPQPLRPLRELAALWRAAGGVLRRAWPWLTLLLLAAAAFAAWFMVSSDKPIHDWLSEGQSARVLNLARQLSYWGDYQTGTLIIGAGLWLLGALLRHIRWRTAALACLLAATLAGLTANVFRYSTGRPRPRAEEADGLRGFRWEDRYHSFVSGHAATSFGTATALAVALPALGLPALAGAVGVSWSRLYLGAHYPVDVLLGAVLGVVMGLIFGLAARRPAPA